MQVTLSPDQEAQLVRIASRTGRDASSLAREAINHLLAHEERFIQAVEKGLASLDRGESISHAEVGQRLAGWLQT